MGISFLKWNVFLWKDLLHIASIMNCKTTERKPFFKDGLCTRFAAYTVILLRNYKKHLAHVCAYNQHVRICFGDTNIQTILKKLQLCHCMSSHEYRDVHDSNIKSLSLVILIRIDVLLIKMKNGKTADLSNILNQYRKFRIELMVLNIDKLNQDYGNSLQFYHYIYL